jgi:hypothetical protein
MKKTTIILFALLLAVPLFAADDGVRGERSQIVKTPFPTLSISQQRPARITTEDEVKCGQHPDLPSNCHYKCRDGVPVLNPDGTQRVLCYAIPEYPCAHYYSCASGAAYCSSNNNVWSGCAYVYGNNSCYNCDFN